MTTQQARILTIASGEDLIAALSAADSGWIQATGHVEGVEVKLAGESTDPTRALRGRLTLVSLIGPAGGPFTATLARATDSGLELVGGVLVRARSAGVTAVVIPTEASASSSTESTSSSDRRSAESSSNNDRRPVVSNDRNDRSAPTSATSSARTPSSAPASDTASAPSPSAASAASPRASSASATPPGSGSGSSSSSSSSSASSNASASSASGTSSPAPAATAGGSAGSVGWGAVAVASEAAAEQAAIEALESTPQRGDLVDHFSFGLCEVVVDDGDRLKIRDLRGAGRIREIAPEMLVIKGPTKHESGKRLYRLLRRG